MRGYPLGFRSTDAEQLGRFIRHRESVEMIGMKRVGINNFLRFFTSHPEVIGRYVSPHNHHFFITIDLYDLVEHDILSFWKLTLKRTYDAVLASILPDFIKDRVNVFFTRGMQEDDLFLLTEEVRSIMLLLTGEKVYPTLFFLRFDRIHELLTDSFMANLRGLVLATNHQLSYVVTTYRPLDELRPELFRDEKLVSNFFQKMYVRPGNGKDMLTILDLYEEKLQITIPPSVKKILVRSSGGHAQYLILSAILIQEGKSLEHFSTDERIVSLSEEIWNSLTKEEQHALQASGGEDAAGISYLTDTGIYDSKRGSMFNRWFRENLSVIEKPSQQREFTEKERILFHLLEQNINHLCERSLIVSHVWPECENIGVTDWAVDRLVARVRSKLKQNKSRLELVTIRTRGYLLQAK